MVHNACTRNEGAFWDQDCVWWEFCALWYESTYEFRLSVFDRGCCQPCVDVIPRIDCRRFFFEDDDLIGQYFAFTTDVRGLFDDLFGV